MNERAAPWSLTFLNEPCAAAETVGTPARDQRWERATRGHSWSANSIDGMRVKRVSSLEIRDFSGLPLAAISFILAQAADDL